MEVWETSNLLRVSGNPWDGLTLWWKGCSNKRIDLKKCKWSIHLIFICHTYFQYIYIYRYIYHYRKCVTKLSLFQVFRIRNVSWKVEHRREKQGQNTIFHMANALHMKHDPFVCFHPHLCYEFYMLVCFHIDFDLETSVPKAQRHQHSTGIVKECVAYYWHIELEHTAPKFNIGPEKWWLEDYFPIGKAIVQGLC